MRQKCLTGRHKIPQNKLIHLDKNETEELTDDRHVTNVTDMLQTDVTMSAPDIPPPTPAEARKALDAAFAEIGLVFKKKPVVIKEIGR